MNSIYPLPMVIALLVPFAVIVFFVTVLYLCIRGEKKERSALKWDIKEPKVIKDYSVNGILHKLDCKVSGVLGKDLPNNPQLIIPQLRRDDKMKLVLSMMDIVVCTEDNQPIGFIKYRFKPLIDKLLANERIDVILASAGATISDYGEELWGCSVKITLYANDSDLSARHQGQSHGNIKDSYWDSLFMPHWQPKESFALEVTGSTHIKNGINPQEIIPFMGVDESVNLVPDPYNEYDISAIRVISQDGNQIGWCPSGLNCSKKLFNLLMEGEEVSAQILEIWHNRNKDIWSCSIKADIRMDINEYAATPEGAMILHNRECSKKIALGALSYIEANPGVLQKDIYKILESEGSDKSSLQDFFRNSNKIRRERSGSTYKLYIE